MMSKCLVIMSGGQDSTTCLFLAMKLYDDVEAVCFNYRQRHQVELDAAREICKSANVKLTEIDLGFLSEIGNSYLTSDRNSVFVCNRNAIFLTVAHGIAQNINATTVVGGMCQGDFSGFSDCRGDFIKSLEISLNMGYKTSIEFEMPLMHKSKAETFQIADELGVLDLIVNKTHTCYNGNHTNKHAWGHGCGYCPSCEVRRKGWESFIQQKHTEMNKG